MKRAKARNTFPVGQLKKLRLRANDILVVNVRRTLSMQDLDAMRASLREFGTQRFLICQDISLTTIRSR